MQERVRTCLTKNGWTPLLNWPGSTGSIERFSGKLYEERTFPGGVARSKPPEGFAALPTGCKEEALNSMTCEELPRK